LTVIVPVSFRFLIFQRLVHLNRLTCARGRSVEDRDVPLLRAPQGGQGASERGFAILGDLGQIAA